MRGNVHQQTRSNKTLSISDTLLKKLEDDAKSNGKSLNAMISSILEKYVFFYRIIETQKDVILSPKVYIKVISLVGQENFLKILDDHNTAIIPAHFVHSNIPLTVDNLIKYFLMGPMVWGGAYSSLKQQTDKKNYTILTLQHKKNIQWSKIMGMGLCKLIQNVFVHQASYIAHEKSVTIKISPKPMN